MEIQSARDVRVGGPHGPDFRNPAPALFLAASLRCPSDLLVPLVVYIHKTQKRSASLAGQTGPTEVDFQRTERPPFTQFLAAAPCGTDDVL